MFASTTAPHARAGVQLRTAWVHPGVSVNDVTDELAVGGNAAFNGAAVEVIPAEPPAKHGRSQQNGTRW